VQIALHGMPRIVPVWLPTYAPLCRFARRWQTSSGITSIVMTGS